MASRWTSRLAAALSAMGMLGGCAKRMSGDAMMRKEMTTHGEMMKDDKAMMTGEKGMTKEGDKGMAPGGQGMMDEK
jgi:hypothetical protein